MRHASSILFEEKIWIVFGGLRGEDSIAELCRRERISQGVYYKWSKDFVEAGKRPLAGGTCVLPRPAKSKTCAVKHEKTKEVAAEQTL